MAMICPSCGLANRDDARFCSSCATPLAQDLICPSCGTRNVPTARFCHQCATPLTGAIAPVGLGTGLLLPKSMLASRYIIVQKIGQGGMGAVYQATDTRLGHKLVAVKEMSDAAITDPLEKQQVRQAFEREAQMLAQLNHPNLPRVTDHFSEGGKQYLVMDFIAGQTLDKVLNQTLGFLDEKQVVDWGVQLCEVLEYLHSQQPPVIFRDLKPTNIMLDRDGKVKLIDFGIARLFKLGKATDTASFGTAGYAPPEQYGKGQTDARSDIYALGATLHHLLTKRDPVATPFHFPPARNINPAISLAVESAVAIATRHNIAERFQTVDEMKQALMGRGETAVPFPSTFPPLTTFPDKMSWAMFRRGPLHIASDGIEPGLPLSLKWTFKADAGVHSSPAVAGGLVLVGADDQKVYALEAKTGAKRWEFKAGGIHVRSSPAVADGMVFVGSDDERLYALDAATGAKRWEFKTGGDVHSSPAVADGLVLVGSDDNKLYALDAATGVKQWEFDAGNWIYCAPVVSAGLVLVTAEEHLYAVEVTTGRKRWEFETGFFMTVNMWLRSSPAVTREAVFVGSVDKKVYALDIAWGGKCWEFKTQGGVYSSPVIDHLLVLIGSDDGRVYALRAATGAKQWEFLTDGKVRSSPAVAGNLVFVGSEDAKIYALDVTTGTKRWEHKTEGKVYSSPAVAEGVMFVGSGDGRVYAFG